MGSSVRAKNNPFVRLQHAEFNLRMNCYGQELTLLWRRADNGKLTRPEWRRSHLGHNAASKGLCHPEVLQQLQGSSPVFRALQIGPDPSRSSFVFLSTPAQLDTQTCAKCLWFVQPGTNPHFQIGVWGTIVLIASQMGWLERLFLQCGATLLTLLVLPVALMQLLPLNTKHTWTKQRSDCNGVHFFVHKTSPFIWGLFFFFSCFEEEEEKHKKKKRREDGRLKIVGFWEEIFLAMKSAEGFLNSTAHQLSQGIKLHQALKLYLPLITQVTFQTLTLIFYFFLHLHIENTLLKTLKKNSCYRTFI